MLPVGSRAVRVRRYALSAGGNVVLEVDGAIVQCDEDFPYTWVIPLPGHQSPFCTLMILCLTSSHSKIQQAQQTQELCRVDIYNVLYRLRNRI